MFVSKNPVKILSNILSILSSFSKMDLSFWEATQRIPQTLRPFSQKDHLIHEARKGKNQSAS